ncbi:hypothetical protein GIB67_042717 [Kingdonia uniflora]|uniref:Uncharacterized protein n=1 Tax=Kingdonia uniflora TaxID=39325 RepID=A0A7J7NDI6_9MAGN|nr:hypothetical protein GIB67_042717 [Kingdonia uniflora]
MCQKLTLDDMTKSLTIDKCQGTRRIIEFINKAFSEGNDPCLSVKVPCLDDITLVEVTTNQDNGHQLYWDKILKRCPGYFNVGQVVDADLDVSDITKADCIERCLLTIEYELHTMVQDYPQFKLITS